MDEIPDDIRKTAANYAYRWTQFQADAARLALLFEEAILAERERFASIRQSKDYR